MSRGRRVEFIPFRPSYIREPPERTALARRNHPRPWPIVIKLCWVSFRRTT
jgi:hypothetical protein